jgi:hypothetical protein
MLYLRPGVFAPLRFAGKKGTVTDRARPDPINTVHRFLTKLRGSFIRPVVESDTIIRKKGRSRRAQMEPAQRKHFSDRIKAQIGDQLNALAAGSSEAYQNRFRELEAAERRRSDATEKFLQLCARSSDLQARAFHELESRTQLGARFLFDAGESRYLISALRPEKGLDKSREIHGLIFSHDYLKDQILRPALLQHSGSRRIVEISTLMF